MQYLFSQEDKTYVCAGCSTILYIERNIYKSNRKKEEEIVCMKKCGWKNIKIVLFKI